MQRFTIVEDFVHAAMKRTELERLEDGTIGASIPGCPGVLAFGADVHECAVDMYARLQDWVRISLTKGHVLPVIDGIDLNRDTEQILATYSDRPLLSAGSEFYASEQEFEAALAKRSKRVPGTSHYGSL